MSWLEVISPSSQQAAHQNQTADTFHTLSFVWAFQGITPCCGDQAAKIHRGMMTQTMLSDHMGMWNLIYRREDRGEGLGPEINPQSCLVGVQFFLLCYTHHCMQFFITFITVHLILAVTGHNSSHLPTPGRSLLWTRGDLGWLGLSCSQPAGGSGHQGMPGKQRRKLQHHLKLKRICLAFPCWCWALHRRPSMWSKFG